MSLCGMLAAGGPDAFIGIWKLDPGNSKFGGGTIYKSRTIEFSVTPAGLKMTSSGIAVDGRVLACEYAARPDGREYPVRGNLGASISLEQRSPVPINSWMITSGGTVLVRYRK